MITANDINPGTKLMQPAHPEYGVWRVLEQYGEGMWNIRGQHSAKCLFESELQFWEIVN